MKRKPPLKKPETVVVPAEMLESAKRAISVDRIKKPSACVVCGNETTGLPDQLCWVCRRLKISAWGEGEQQMPAQE